MIRVAQELFKADRTRSLKMHLHAISECLPIFAAAGHSNYLKSAYLYLQKMTALESENPFVFQQFMNGAMSYDTLSSFGLRWAPTW